MTWVIVPAAGSGRRFDPDLPKQYWQIGELCVLEHTLARLLSHPGIEGVMVALAPDDQRFEALPCAGDPRVLRVIGGAERADSVRSALAALPDSVRSDDPVLVHDAARPCLDAELLDRLLAAGGDPAGALLALPVVDTLKRSAGDEPARVELTAERSRYWQAQTPQLFRRGLLQQALGAAAQQGLLVTDESMAVERLGHAPRLVLGSADNRKLTSPEDLEPMAAWLLGHPLL